MDRKANLTFAARNAVYFLALQMTYQLASRDGYKALVEPIGLAVAFFLGLFLGSLFLPVKGGEHRQWLPTLLASHVLGHLIRAAK